MTAVGIAEPHLSVSQLNTWLQCPRKYRYQYVDRVQWPAVPSTLVFGSAIHEALSVLYEARLQGREPTIQDLHDSYRVAWAGEPKPIELKDGETAEALDSMAKALLGVVLDRPQPGRVLAVEERFRIELSPDLPPLVGIIDLVVEQDGKAIVIEHKTAGQRFTEQRVGDDIQPTAYGLAAVEMGLPGIATIEDVEVRYQVLLKLKKPSLDERSARRTQRQADELREIALAVWQAREVGIYPPNRGWACAGCPFERQCRGA